MKLSLMTINLVRELFFDEKFRPKNNPDIREYENILKMAVQAGYHAVDMTDMECAQFGTENVRQLLDRYGLACASVILFEDYICADPVRAARVKEHTFQAIEDAGRIGCRTVMLVASNPYPDMPWEEKRSHLAENLRCAVEYAAERRITVCVEDFPSTQIPLCASDDMEFLLTHVPGLMLTYDTANMLAAGEDSKEYYERFRKRIGYCHLKDIRFAQENESAGDLMCDGRKMITTVHGRGEVDFSSVFEWFKRDGYDGYLSVEYAQDGEEPDLLRRLTDERIYLEQFM